MYILDINVWFTKLIKQFFFWIDKIVYNFISSIYDLMIAIARTSPLSQADIAEMAERIYMLLAVFMIFKVTLSLITYVVNPDDFSDKSKGISKLGVNAVISLALLVLTPYIFNYAYQLQTIILEDNSLATLILGDSSEDENQDNVSFFNTAGDEMAYLTMSAFISPNLSLSNACVLDGNDAICDLSNCVNLVEKDPDNPKKSIFNPDCSKVMGALVGGGGFTGDVLANYIAGVENHNLGLLFRQDLVLSTEATDNGEIFIMDYKFIFSTAVGVIVILLLITFCMDVAVRSIKLSFLQLIAPIPILSYVDPKSGKDGMFKKWYQMCFKTYLSLFIRLLALYFAVYIISKVADMQIVDIIDGSYQTNRLIGIMIIIGALMFAKQLPKLLEGLGIKLDGDGKFFLNPLKKFEDQALGGKNITGLARGALVGTAGALSGAGIFRGISGAWRGMTSGKGWTETGKAEVEMNKKMRQAKLDGSSFGGRIGARFAGTFGLPSESERVEGRIHQIDEEIKKIDNDMAPSKKLAEEKKLYTSAVSAMEKRAIEKIEAGEAGVLSKTYRQKQAHIDSLKAQLDEEARNGHDTTAIEEQIAIAENDSRNYLNDVAMKVYIDANKGKDIKTKFFDVASGKEVDVEYKAADIFGTKDDGTVKDDAALTTMTKKMETIVDTYGANHKNMVKGNASDIHAAMGRTKSEISAIENENEKHERDKRNKTEEKQSLYEQQRKAKADESAIK